MAMGRWAFLGILILSGIIAANTFGYRKFFMSQEIKEIEEISGSNFCGDGKIIDIGRVGDLNVIRPRLNKNESPLPRRSSDQIRQAILLSFPDNETPCIDLGHWPHSLWHDRNPPQKKMTGFVEINKTKIPLVLTRRDDSDVRGHDFDQRLIVRLSGGPGGIPIGAMSDFFIPLNANDILIDFLYTGSGTNLVHPGPNFNSAVSQVHSFLESLRRRNRKAEIVLVGESLGGVIALTAMERTSSMVDKLVLISPVASSIQSFLDRSRSMSSQVDERSLLEIYRVLESAEDDWTTSDIRQLNRIDVLSRFFPEDAVSDTIADRASRVSDVPMLVIYGDRDPIIGLGEIDDLKSMKAVSLEEISGMEHTFSNLGHVKQMQDAIELFSNKSHIADKSK